MRASTSFSLRVQEEVLIYLLSPRPLQLMNSQRAAVPRTWIFHPADRLFSFAICCYAHCTAIWVFIPFAIMLDSYAEISRAFKVAAGSSVSKSKKVK